MKDIKGYEGKYAATKDGYIWSYPKYRQHHGKFLKPSFSQKYGHVTLWLNNKSKIFLVHRLVALTFLPNPSKCKEVNHLNGDKRDNRVYNLEWVTPKQNGHHASKNGLYKPVFGESNPNSKLTVKQVLDIKKDFEHFTYGGVVKWARKLGVTECTIENIKSRRTWQHLVFSKV